MATLTERIEKAKQRAELVRLNREASEDKLRSRMIKRATMKYDSLDTNNDLQRKQPQPTRTTPDLEQTSHQRLKGASLGRNLQENNAPFKSIVRQFNIAAVGTGPKLLLQTGDGAFDGVASAWFNGDWAKWCDGVDDTPLAELVGNTIEAVKREGDVLWVVDDFDRNDCTVRVFESDQLVTINQKSWEINAGQDDSPWKERLPGAEKDTPMCQENGIVRDYRGRVVAYIVTNDHGKAECDFEDATIVPRWDQKNNPNGSGKLIKRPWRFGQHRGQGEALTVSNALQDIYEMTAAELGSAKAAAKVFAWVKPESDGEGGVMRALQEQTSLTNEQIEKIMYGDGSDGSGVVASQYKNLESLTGGLTEYLQGGDDIQVNDHDRPESAIKDFGEFIQGSAGASMGLGRSRALMKADTSYTAFRGEELMSWATFAVEQKWLERRLMDWLAIKAIGWALVHGELSGAPDGWENAMRWDWPKMPEVDAVKSANATATQLKSGTTNFSDRLGPNWRQHFDRLAEEKDYAEQLGLPLSLFETVAGAPAETKETNDD